MEPTLQAGDRVQIRLVSAGVKKGWVVVFAWQGQILTHRVIRTRDQRFWARGDACAHTEGPVPCHQVIGRVEGYWRDGEWHSLSGWQREILGLAYNQISSRARRLARQWPGLGGIVDLDAYRKIGGWVYGDIYTQDDNRVERVLGALVSDADPLTQRLVADVEEHLAKGDLNLIVARSVRVGWVGHILLSRVEPDAGCLTSLRVSFGARGLGVDRLLIEAAEASARSRGWKRLLAPPSSGNRRREELYYLQGYRPAGDMFSKSLESS
jgi:GNAT superfamily N-acetyltransferase